MKGRLRVLFSLLLTTVLVMSLFTGLVSGKQVKNGEDYDYHVVRDVMVEMRDGVKLSTDLYLPAPTSKKEEKQGFPTLVLRTPYNKDTYGGAEGPFFAQKGYAVVVQDTRGRFKSEGEWDFIFDDANDGYDLIEWAAAQEFSNGKVGTMGLSYMAYTQYVLAKSKPPHLVTMIPLEGASNFAEEVFFTGGAMQLDRYLSWTLGQSHDTARRMDEQNGNTYYQEQLANVNYQELLNYTPRNGITLLNELQGWWKEALQSPEYGAYWKEISPQEWHDSWPVPTYHVGGWYDILLSGTSNNYIGITENGPEKRKLKTVGKPINIRESQKLMIGPWTHGYPTKNVGEAVFPEADLSDVHNGENGTENWRLEQLRWFDYWLKGIKNGVMDEDPVKLYVMDEENSGYWRTEKEWPLARTEYTKYYLRDGKSGTIHSLNDGVLSPEKPKANEKPDAYTYDPDNPVETVGGNLSGTTPASKRGPQDQQEIEQGVLTFTTDALKEDTEVTGPIEVKLWASSSAKDTDFAVKLTEVSPDGRSIIIQDSIIRARYRESREKETLLNPGEVYEYTIDLGTTSNIFNKGNRIRVDVSSSNYPRFDNNPNTGNKWGTDSESIIAENTIYHDSEHPSHIILPIIPSK
ncbi:CocE/NonD family hydrolase [Bacillus sp. ISL-47]|uniref:CocE/NonD family hydrolase n=1 Tax=Bacillus sp. ISL-47 TaxID=2819130 RepID=UPI001BE5EE0A|nr:CocE/NonD family hydrolase [Bacillus sp. ISL-47]MBT2689254.1 CocE/NonD family hydrolase [Bacillus sp. ISL-47]MBT2708621.1 CocE/NonD family hydrolase [Pseudomonas sp. ISL-84]